MATTTFWLIALDGSAPTLAALPGLSPEAHEASRPALLLTNPALDAAEQTDYAATRPEVVRQLQPAHEALLREIDP